MTFSIIEEGIAQKNVNQARRPAGFSNAEDVGRTFMLVHVWLAFARIVV
jgi:hypothetical protein